MSPEPVGALVVLVLAIGALLSLARKAWRPSYVRRPLMTPNEQEFFRRLEAAAHPGYVFPQVAMSALIAVKTGGGNTELAAFRKISQKRVDYAIFDQALKLACVVELDDRTHDASRDRERDALLSSAGINTIRWESHRKPTVSEIQAKLVLQGFKRATQGRAAR